MLKTEILIPPITHQERINGVEYSHIMLKPEAVIQLAKDRVLRADLIGRLQIAGSILDLQTVSHFTSKLNRATVDEIYRTEIRQGIIPDWELQRFCDSTTEHFIVKGKDATVKTAILKGAFACTPEKCFKGRISATDFVRFRGIFTQTSCSAGRRKDWGSGCGIRGYLATKRLVFPDPGETTYTVYNWIHCPDPGQHFAVDVVINAINSK